MQAYIKVIEFLNKPLLASEYASIQQYEYHKAVADNIGLTVYSAYLQERIDDERKHAKALRDQILFLGGSPIVDPSKISNADDIQDQLSNDGESETQAIEDYKRGIALAVGLGDDQSAKVMRANLADEADHLNDIDARQSQIEMAGFANWITTQI